MESVQVATGWELWLPPTDDQQAFWPSCVTLSTEIHQSILAAPIPINLDHLADLRALRGSGLSIDIYTWLAWRMFNLKSSTLITWQRLAQQFGTDYTRTPRRMLDDGETFTTVVAALSVSRTTLYRHFAHEARSAPIVRA